MIGWPRREGANVWGGGVAKRARDEVKNMLGCQSVKQTYTAWKHTRVFFGTKSFPDISWYTYLCLKLLHLGPFPLIYAVCFQ